MVKLNCEQVWQEISNYLEGDVDAGLRSAMDDHFRTCKKCVSVLEGTRNVIRLYGDERMIEAPSGFGKRLERRLERSAGAHSRRWSTWSAWLVPVAALVLIAGGVRIASSLAVPRPLLSEHAQPGRDIPGDLVVIVSTGAKDFHVPGCGFIHDKDKDKERTLTAREAIHEGYVPCVRCMRKYLQTAAVGTISLELEAEEYDGAGKTGASR
ncbi:MAG TPA: zf-HC2 domain-containing protein [Candidatus Binatia bacterium]|jgi:hypothetical protein|nr:zf-HC2 domain-containing protein [Candidatus Binatia bacterium]